MGKKWYPIATVTGYVQAHLFIFREKSHPAYTHWPHLLSQRVGVQWRDRGWRNILMNINMYLFFMLFCFFLFFYVGGWRNQNSLGNVCLFIMRSKLARPSQINWLIVLQVAWCLEKCYFFHKILSFWRLGLFILVLHITSFRRGDKLICCTVGICLNEMWVSGWDIWLQKGQRQWQES